jgi:hypothetical protein
VTGLSAINTSIPDDLAPTDADLDVQLGAPFNEDIRIRGAFDEHRLKWPTKDCTSGCYLEVPVEIDSNIELPDGVTWGTRWTLSIAFPDPDSDGDDLGSHGWVVDADGSSSNEFAAAGPEKVELQAGETVRKVVTLSTTDAVAPWDHPVALMSLSPSEVEETDTWPPIEVGLDRRTKDGFGLPDDSKFWLTAPSPGIVEANSLSAQWELPVPACKGNGCSLQFAVSFRSDSQTTFWWIPILHTIPSGSKLTLSG